MSLLRERPDEVLAIPSLWKALLAQAPVGKAQRALEHDPGVAEGLIPDKPPPASAEGRESTRFALMSCQHPAFSTSRPR